MGDPLGVGSAEDGLGAGLETVALGAGLDAVALGAGLDAVALGEPVDGEAFGCWFEGVVPAGPGDIGAGAVPPGHDGDAGTVRPVVAAPATGDPDPPAVQAPSAVVQLCFRFAVDVPGGGAAAPEVLSGCRDPDRLASSEGAETSRPGPATRAAGSPAPGPDSPVGPEKKTASTVPDAPSRPTATSASAKPLRGFA